MYKDKYFSELQRRLDGQGLEVAVVDGSFEVRWQSEAFCRVNGAGDTWAVVEPPHSDEAHALYHQTAREAKLVHEYMTALDAAPALKAGSLDEKYKLLADFGGVVLAGTESSRGPQFVTWQWSYDRSYVTLGHYYGDNYTVAKEDFACRSGLVDDNRLFNNEQLAEIYLGLRQRLDDLSLNLSSKQDEVIEDAASQIEHLLPGVEQKYEQQLQQQQQEQEEGSGLDMTMY